MHNKKHLINALFPLFFSVTSIPAAYAMESSENPDEAALLNTLQDIKKFSEETVHKLYQEKNNAASTQAPNTLTTTHLINTNQPNLGETPVQSSLMFQNVALSDEVAQSIWHMAPKQIKSLIHSMQDYENNAECLPKVIVLYGPHGSGKSKTAALIAQMTGRNLFFINTAFLGTTYMNSETTNLGEAVAQIAKLNMPCVIVIDEADTLSKSKDQTNERSAGLDAAIAQLLDTYENNPNIFFVWTTNNIGKIEEKFLDRIGDNIFKIDNPNRASREKILALYAASYKNAKLATTIDLHAIAKKTKGFSIRRLKDLAQEARRLATLRPGNTTITQKDFEKAYKNKQKLRNAVNAASRKERILRHFKKYATLYNIGIPVATTILATTFNYFFMHKSLLAQQERLAREQKDLTIKEGMLNRNMTIMMGISSHISFALGCPLLGPLVLMVLMCNSPEVLIQMSTPCQK